MTEYDIALAMIILLTGIIIILMLNRGGNMSKFSDAIARVQASADKTNAKIDALLAGQEAAVESALGTAAEQLNTIADQLDSKNG